jgi:hypothetical protein
MSKASNAAEDLSGKEGQAKQPFNTSLADGLSQIKLDATDSEEQAKLRAEGEIAYFNNLAAREEAEEAAEGTAEEIAEDARKDVGNLKVAPNAPKAEEAAEGTAEELVKDTRKRKLRAVTEEDAEAEKKQRNSGERPQNKAKLISILLREIEDIDNFKNLERFARKQKGRELLKGEGNEKGWSVDVKESYADSRELVRAINDRKSELIRRERQLRAIENTENGPDLEDLAFELAEYLYLVKRGRGKDFTVKAGKRFGGEMLAKAVMKRKEIFLKK